MKLQEVILRNYRGFRISLQYIIAAREYEKNAFILFLAKNFLKDWTVTLS